MSPLAETLGDDDTRVKLGASPETPAELLYFLARDASVTVRAAVAMNQNSPPPADAVLANDADECVRSVLGRKIALIAAGLCDQAQSRLERVLRSLLRSLVIDEAERVRAIIADVLKDLPNAPGDIVRRLAQDPAISVSEPIIRFSPLLTEVDLLELLASPPCLGTAGAVARRRDLSETLSDAIVATANSSAIRDLLENPFAAIRETTLDFLVVEARDHISWHEPIVRRPRLSPSSMIVLSGILTDHLLETLLGRNDLDPELQAELRSRLIGTSERCPQTDGCLYGNSAKTLAQAQEMDQSGRLTEATLTQIIRSGEDTMVTAMLAVAAKVTLPVVLRAVSLRSAKGLVSLVWRAGFNMRSAVAIQVLLARVPPGSLVLPAKNGAFPLTADEMRWQIEFLESSTKNETSSWADHCSDATLSE